LVKGPDKNSAAGRELSTDLGKKPADPVEESQISDVLRDPQIAQLLKDSPEARVVFTQLVRHFEFCGPLPPASELQAYDRVVPGLAEKIVNWADEEGRHRRAMEQIVIPANSRRASLGQIFAFVIALAVIGSGTAVILTGHSAYGMAIIITALVGLVGVFAAGRITAAKQLSRSREDEEDT
jgi:uncharacterized membrane protein